MLSFYNLLNAQSSFVDYCEFSLILNVQSNLVYLATSYHEDPSISSYFLIKPLLFFPRWTPILYPMTSCRNVGFPATCGRFLFYFTFISVSHQLLNSQIVKIHRSNVQTHCHHHYWNHCHRISGQIAYPDGPHSRRVRINQVGLYLCSLCLCSICFRWQQGMQFLK